MAEPPAVPQYHELLWPTLVAVRSLGNTATLAEINEKVIDQEGFTDEQQAVLHKEGPQPSWSTGSRGRART